MTLALVTTDPGPLVNQFGRAEVASPEWWLRRLHTEIVNRQPDLELFDAYYRGDHPLPWLPRQAQAEFRRILRMTRSNMMGLVVDATAERLALEGFRLAGQNAADQESWTLWKSNDLDFHFDMGLLEGLKGGTFYTLVEPTGTPRPNIYVEHPSQAVVAYEPGSNRRRKVAGLKLWVDDWTGRLNATLDLKAADGAWLYKFEADLPRGGVQAAHVQWRRREVAGESWPARNPLGEVALTECPNNPTLLGGGVSEIADVIDVQDRINKTVADRLMTQDYGAFPQKWATGYPEEDAQGNAAEPIDIGRDRVVTTDVAETRFGQWETAPMDPYSSAKREDAKDIASRTRVPAQYLLGEMSNVNGEALALDTPIPTPHGFVPIGDIHDGDEVYDETGTVQTVEHAHPVLLNRDCYRVMFDDGAAFVADAGHRWAVVSVPERMRARGPKTRTARTETAVLTTRQIADTLTTDSGHYVHSVPLAGAPDGPEQGFPVDPYVLGVWLGDGNVRHGSICSGDEDLAVMAHLLRQAGENLTIRKTRTVNLITCHRQGERKALRGRLAEIGVLNDKHIPEAYYRGSYKQRLALLQGLMDTDGSAVKRQKGSVEITLHHERLANDVHRLACSLGDKVKLAANQYRGYTRWRMRWNPADEVFRLPRKADVLAERATDRPKARRRVIVAVEAVPSVPVRCLTVSGPSHLFLAGVEHVPTHNTLKASESGLVAKCRQRTRSFGQGAVGTIWLARRAAGLPDADARMEAIWRNTEFRTEGETMDAAVKGVQTGIYDVRYAREYVGMSQTAITEMERREAAADPVVAQIARTFQAGAGMTGGAAG